MIQEFLVYDPIRYEDELGGYHEDMMGFGMQVRGYLDLLSGSNRQFNKELAFAEEATHVLIVPQYQPGISDRMIIKDQDTGKKYRVTYVDNPVGVNHHVEIYLKEL